MTTDLSTFFRDAYRLRDSWSEAAVDDVGEAMGDMKDGAGEMVDDAMDAAGDMADDAEDDAKKKMDELKSSLPG